MLKASNQRACGLFVFRIELPDLGVEQVPEVERGRARPFLRRGGIGIKAPPPLGLSSRHIRPPDLLRVSEDSGLDSFVFAGGGHGYRCAERSADSLVRANILLW